MPQNSAFPSPLVKGRDGEEKKGGNINLEENKGKPSIRATKRTASLPASSLLAIIHHIYGNIGKGRGTKGGKKLFESFMAEKMVYLPPSLLGFLGSKRTLSPQR